MLQSVKKTTTFLELAERILRQTAYRRGNLANIRKARKKLKGSGKTTWMNLPARLYVKFKDSNSSLY